VKPRRTKQQLLSCAIEILDPMGDPPTDDLRLLHAVATSLVQVGPPEDVQPNWVVWGTGWERRFLASARAVLAQHDRERARTTVAPVPTPGASRSTALRPTPSDAAIMQARALGRQLAPPPPPTKCSRPPVAYIALDDAGEDIITVEGPAEVEPHPLAAASSAGGKPRPWRREAKRRNSART
jgi:hypothetical protein